MQATRKYVVLCLGLHRIGNDKATYTAQNTDKRYINARTPL